MRPKTKQKRNDGGQKYPIIIICNEIHLCMDKFHWEKFLWIPWTLSLIHKWSYQMILTQHERVHQRKLINILTWTFLMKYIAKLSSGRKTNDIIYMVNIKSLYFKDTIFHLKNTFSMFYEFIRLKMLFVIITCLNINNLDNFMINLVISVLAGYWAGI